MSVIVKGGGGENVKAEVEYQTPVITQIAENLGVTITTPSGTNKQILQGNNTNLLNIKNNAKKEGLYVWKKCSYVSSPTVTAQQTVADPSTFVLSSNDTDLTAYSFSDLIGLHLASDSSIKTYFEVIGDGTVKYYWNGSTYEFLRCTWDSSTKTLVVVGADYNGVNDNYTVSGLVGKKVLADYVVSDSPTAYPDGAVHTDGYWYEKMVEGIPLPSVFTKYAIDKFTYSSKTKANDLNIKHSLGEKPLFAYIFAGTKNLDNYDLFFMAPKWKMTMGSSGIGVAGQAYSITSSIGTSTYVILDSYIECYFKAGVEYTLITMA